MCHPTSGFPGRFGDIHRKQSWSLSDSPQYAHFGARRGIGSASEMWSSFVGKYHSFPQSVRELGEKRFGQISPEWIVLAVLVEDHPKPFLDKVHLAVRMEPKRCSLVVKPVELLGYCQVKLRRKRNSRVISHLAVHLKVGR